MNYSKEDLKKVIEQKTDIKLSPNIQLGQLLKTSQKADNWPEDPGVIQKLKYLADNVLEKAIKEFGTIAISSGYRSPAVNKLVGGSSTSQHSLGEAADFEFISTDNATVAKWIKNHLVFDQLILEFYNSGDINSGWVHCSVVAHRTNRKQVLTARKNGKKTQYLPGLVA